MIRPRRTLKSNKGTALVTGLIVMMMVSMFGIAYVTLTSTNLIRAGREERRATTFHLAEAGLEYVIAQIISQAETNGGVITAQTYNTAPLLSSLRSGASGSVVVTPEASNTHATITSMATYRGITERIRVRLRIRNVNVWNNAIFAGIGQAGRGINGNVDIRGSVHILGEGDPFSDLNGNGLWDPAESFVDPNGNGVFEPGLGETFTDSDGNGVWSPAEPYQDNNLNGVYDPPLTATELASDMSGNANIGNNYSGIPAGLQAKIPALVPSVYGGDTVRTLDAELRVKHGRVNVSGTATVGDPNVPGNAFKETVDGCYVTDGYGGNQGTNNVYSDNGTTTGYDLGDRIPFPGLFDEYTDPDTGTTYSTHENYLLATSLLVPVPKIDNTVASFSYTDGTNSFSWDKAANTLTISGIVRINGNLDLSAKGTTVNYSGRGTLFVNGSIYVHGSVMPVATFPATDVMGCIAKYDIEFATGGGEAQLMGAGAWYAQRKIKSAKQNQFAGTYVANYFDMGTNVPSIYQVPALAQNMPPGMPGGDAVIAAQVLSWRHL